MSPTNTVEANDVQKGWGREDPSLLMYFRVVQPMPVTLRICAQAFFQRD
jgi:hypothetical protein